MGVPAFFRWLSEKYPKIVQDVLEDRVHVQPGTNLPLPFDSTAPNPSGIECDNLYIDMNGIIHPCSHPEKGPQPTTEVEMYENVCHYVDRLFRIMRPRKLLYLAIDGVAPRAKMNQQRARRFRSAEEAKELKELEQHVRETMSKDGQRPPPAKEAWDSNVITPGTKFMMELATHVRFYIRKRMQQDKAWKNIRVIFSDASIPGEGEHKIMSHIRLQRSQPGYDPNLVHVLHGLDADLIMLALATHEAHFYISREEVQFGRKSQEITEQRQMESGFKEAQQLLDEAAGSEAMSLLENSQTPLQRISIPILREYLAAEFQCCLTPGSIPFAPSLERLIDDIVFLCFFVGNDFLPHLPSLDIRDGALDFLFNVYKRILPSLGDYITKSGGNVNLSHVDVILAEVGAIEDYVFQLKHENEERNKRFQEEQKSRRKQQQGRKDDGRPPQVQPAQEPRARMGRAAKILEKQQQEAVALSKGHQAKEDARHAKKVKHMMGEDNAQAAQALKDSLGQGTVTKKEEPVEQQQADSQPIANQDAEMEDRTLTGSKRTHDEVDEPNSQDGDADTAAIKSESSPGVVGEAEDEFDDDAGDDEIDENLPKVDDIIEEVDPEAARAFKASVQAKVREKLDEHAKIVQDNVRLHEPGWKDRYYRDKCKADDVSKHGGREHLFRSYVVGLCWVMKYYYDGCPSWKWYYPFHYAPFASDLKNIERFQKDCRSFEINTPFNPVEQLMAVLPPDSSHSIPKEARWLMLDKESPIIDFYPSSVPVDPNGKAMPWLWVVLLPFIEEDRLLAAMGPTMAKWTKEELLCNARGMDDGYLYVHTSHPFSKKLLLVVDGGKTATAPKTKLTDSAAHGVKGFTGSVRPPLSHEMYPMGDEVSIPTPSTSNRINNTGSDSIFGDKLYSNEVVAVAFTEPLKLSHKSILLPGARPPPPSLTASDKVIRRPRLNRGGGTIANMGGSSNNNSHRQGYGSMNISSYERQLAEQTGRGNQMNQAGTRSWGSMEPAPKRRPPPHVANPFMQQNAPGGQPAWQGQQQGRHPPQQQGRQYQNQQQQQYPPQQQWQPQQYYQQPGAQQQQQQQNYQQQYPPQQQQQYGYQQQGQWNQSHRGPAQQHQHPPPPTRGGYAQQRQGYDFRSFTQQGGRPQPGPSVPQGTAVPSRASADVMANLKQQLASTLNKNKRQS